MTITKESKDLITIKSNKLIGLLSMKYDIDFEEDSLTKVELFEQIIYKSSIRMLVDCRKRGEVETHRYIGNCELALNKLALELKHPNSEKIIKTIYEIIDLLVATDIYSKPIRLTPKNRTIIVENCDAILELLEGPDSAKYSGYYRVERIITETKKIATSANSYQIGSRTYDRLVDAAEGDRFSKRKAEPILCFYIYNILKCIDDSEFEVITSRQNNIDRKEVNAKMHSHCFAIENLIKKSTRLSKSERWLMESNIVMIDRKFKTIDDEEDLKLIKGLCSPIASLTVLSESTSVGREIYQNILSVIELIDNAYIVTKER